MPAHRLFFFGCGRRPRCARSSLFTIALSRREPSLFRGIPRFLLSAFVEKWKDLPGPAGKICPVPAISAGWKTPPAKCADGVFAGRRKIDG